MVPVLMIGLLVFHPLPSDAARGGRIGGGDGGLFHGAVTVPIGAERRRIPGLYAGRHGPDGQRHRLGIIADT